MSKSVVKLDNNPYPRKERRMKLLLIDTAYRAVKEATIETKGDDNNAADEVCYFFKEVTQERSKE